MAKEKQDYKSVKEREKNYKRMLQELGALPDDKPETLTDKIDELEEKCRMEVRAAILRCVQGTGRPISAPLGAVGDPTGVMTDYGAPFTHMGLGMRIHKAIEDVLANVPPSEPMTATEIRFKREQVLPEVEARMIKMEELIHGPLFVDVRATIENMERMSAQADVCKAAGRFLRKHGQWQSPGQAGTWARKKIVEGYKDQVDDEDDGLT